MKKKIVIALLMFCMSCSLFPAELYAQEETVVENEEIEEKENEECVKENEEELEQTEDTIVSTEVQDPEEEIPEKEMKEKGDWIEYEPNRYGDVEKGTKLHKDPFEESEILLEIEAGERVLLDGYEKNDQGNWYKIVGEEIEGYVSAEDVELSYQSYEPEKAGETTANLYMRDGVGGSYNKKKYIPSGSEVMLLGYYRTEGYDWYKVEYGGSTGYVSSKCVVKMEDKVEWVEYAPDRYGDVQKDVFMNSQPRGEGEELAEIQAESRIVLKGYKKFYDGSWYQVLYEGKTGYVSSGDVKLSFQPYTPTKVGKITENLYIRSGVGLSYDKKKYAPSGSKMVLLGYYRTEGYDWYKVKYNGTSGYISSKYVVRMEDEAKWVGYSPDRYGDVKRTAVLNSQPRGEGTELIEVPKGARILLQGYQKFLSGSWYKTSYDGKTGYISADDVKLSYQSYDPTKIGEVTANLYMRSGVGASYSKKKYLPSKSKVILLGYYRTEGYDWYKVQHNGTTGYVSSKYVDVLNITTKLKKVTDKNSAMYGKTLKLYYSNGKQIQNLENIVGKKSNYILYVNKSKQMVTAYYKEGSYYVPYRAMICSSGALSSYTPNGTSYTPAKYRWHTLMGPSWGQWCTRINGGVLFHSVFYNSKNNNQTLSVSAYNKLGTPASHGCVRLTAGDAKWIYDNCKLKTKVVVCNKSGYEPLRKPIAYKLGASHRWDPTDPNMKYKCKQKGCH